MNFLNLELGQKKFLFFQPGSREKVYQASVRAPLEDVRAGRLLGQREGLPRLSPQAGPAAARRQRRHQDRLDTRHAAGQ